MIEEKALRTCLLEISECLAALPAGPAKGSHGTYIAHAPPTTGKTVDALLDHIRLQVKYLLFDLEATRRENHYLREMIERRPNLGADDPDAP